MGSLARRASPLGGLAGGPPGGAANCDSNRGTHPLLPPSLRIRSSPSLHLSPSSPHPRPGLQPNSPPSPSTPASLATPPHHHPRQGPSFTRLFKRLLEDDLLLQEALLTALRPPQGGPIASSGLLFVTAPSRPGSESRQPPPSDCVRSV